MSHRHALKDKVAVVGVGHTSYGSFPETDDFGLGAEAFKNAMADCGLEKSQIDGLMVCRVPSYARMGDILGIRPRWTLALPGEGRMASMGIIEAAAAIDAGLTDYAALIYTNISRSRRVIYGGDGSPNMWNPWGYTSPGAAHAMMFQRHMAMYGTTTRQLAEVSVAFRRYAQVNPGAIMRAPMTIDDHESSPFIAEPLRLLDYCLVNDGAVCMILTTRDRAKDLRKRPVLISGLAGRDAYDDASIPTFGRNFWYEELREVGQAAFGMAGVTAADVDAFYCYDNFSPTILFALEGLGFCGRGEAGAFVEGGRLAPGGSLPTNTDGGHLSNSYMQGWALNVEAVRQLRGECDRRQVRDAEVTVYTQATPCVRAIVYTRG